MKSLKEQFLEVLSDYQGILHKVNIIYFRNKTDREDNFQEMVYQLWKSYPTLKKSQSIGSWIYAVSINTSISRIRKEKKIEYRENVPEIADHSNVADQLMKNESLKLLLKAIYNLDEVDKSIMLLYLEERSYDEIAEIIGISKTYVGVRIGRAKEKLKQHFNNK